MSRVTALTLLVAGHSIVASLSPLVAITPAFLAYLAAGAILARATLSEPRT
jgi:hypothetical protein